MAKTIHTYGDAPELARLLKLPSGRASFGCFKSPESLTAILDPMPVEKFWHQGGKQSGRESFTGTETWAAAVALARDGWREGAERVARLRDKINAANPTGPRMVRYGVAGAYPVVARAVAGNPMNMRSIDTARIRRRPVVTLISDVCASGNVSKDVITRRAAATAAIVDAVEAAGFSCEVVAFARVKAGGKSNFAGHVMVTVKEAGQPVDVARLAYGLGHASMFRRQMFLAFGMDTVNTPLGQCLGYPEAIAPHEVEPGAFIVPGFGMGKNDKTALFTTDDSTATRGLAWLVAGLAEQGCPAFETERAA